MNTCGTCKFRGDEVTELDGGIENMVGNGFFLCGRIKHLRDFDEKNCRSYVMDYSGCYAALCVSTDFGCNEWEAK